MSKVKCNVWKQVHNVVKDHQAHGMAQDVKAKVWKSLDKLFVFCDKVSWNKNDQLTFEEEVKNFRKTMRKEWTTYNITHYMVTTLPSPQLFNFEK